MGRWTLIAEVREAIGVALERPAGESSARAAARIHHAARKGEPLPPGFEDRVDWLLAELGRGEWIEGYARGNVVAARLDGIRARLGFEPLGAERSAELAVVLDGAIERARGEIDGILGMAV